MDFLKRLNILASIKEEDDIRKQLSHQIEDIEFEKMEPDLRAEMMARLLLIMNDLLLHLNENFLVLFAEEDAGSFRFFQEDGPEILEMAKEMDPHFENLELNNVVKP